MPEKNIQELLGIKNSTEFASMLKLNSIDVMTASKHFFFEFKIRLENSKYFRYFLLTF